MTYIWDFKIIIKARFVENSYGLTKGKDTVKRDDKHFIIDLFLQ